VTAGGDGGRRAGRDRGGGAGADQLGGGQPGSEFLVDEGRPRGPHTTMEISTHGTCAAAETVLSVELKKSAVADSVPDQSAIIIST